MEKEKEQKIADAIAEIRSRFEAEMANPWDLSVYLAEHGKDEIPEERRPAWAAFVTGYIAALYQTAGIDKGGAELSIKR